MTEVYQVDYNSTLKKVVNGCQSSEELNFHDTNNLEEVTHRIIP